MLSVKKSGFSFHVMGDSYYDKSGVVRSINSINQKSFSFCFENRFWELKVMVFFVLLWESWDHLKKFSVVIAILAKFSNHQRLQQFHHFFGLERISFENMIFHLWVLLFPGTSEINWSLSILWVLVHMKKVWNTRFGAM